MKNNRDSIALLAAAVVLLAGSIAVGLGAIAEAIPEHQGLFKGALAENAGKILLFAGGAAFVVILCSYFLDSRKE